MYSTVADRWKTMALTLALTTACVVLGFSVVRSWVRLGAVRDELAAVRAQADEARSGAQRLNAEAERRSRPAWLALLARARLNFKEPGETVVFVYKSEKSDSIAPPHAPRAVQPNWRLWLDWALGKRD